MLCEEKNLSYEAVMETIEAALAAGPGSKLTVFAEGGDAARAVVDEVGRLSPPVRAMVKRDEGMIEPTITGCLKKPRRKASRSDPPRRRARRRRGHRSRGTAGAVRPGCERLGRRCRHRTRRPCVSDLGQPPGHLGHLLLAGVFAALRLDQLQARQRIARIAAEPSKKGGEKTWHRPSKKCRGCS